jgi:hypothetical protein
MISARRTAWIDGAVALLYLALFVWAVYTANAAAADAVRRYGYNVDSGAIVFVAAIFYFAPVALLFGLAAVSLSRGWRVQWYVHWLAVLCAVGPLFLPGVAFVHA